MKFLLGRALYVSLILGISGLCGAAQFESKAEKLDSFLDRAEDQSQEYTHVFRNLSAEEIKTKLYYKRNGKLDEKRVIRSLFIVYQSPHNNTVQEFRNVREFNGKIIDRGNEKTKRFFRKLAMSESAVKEHIKIRRLGTRFDGRVVSWGITLTQPRPFSQELRRLFSFSIHGREMIEGREYLVIRYRQIKKSILITSSPSLYDQITRQGGTEYSTPTSLHLRPTNPLMNGKIWLDAETAQIFRNEFEIVLHPKALSKPVTNVRIVYEYAPSTFGIYVPKRFTIFGFRLTGKNDKTLRVTKDAESIYEYSKFSEFKTDVQVYDKKEDQ